MGQYYRPTIIEPDGRIQTTDPYVFGSGAKLTEHSWISNELVNTAYALIHKSPKKVAWIGDYSRDDYDPAEEPYARALPLSEFKKIYASVWGSKRKGLPAKRFSKQDLEILNHDTKGMYLINHDKQEYINLAIYIRDNTARGGTWDGYCMNPLPLLTACGNGRGGGDYHEGHVGYEDIGIWAFDCLEYTDVKPDGFTEAIFYFNEHKEVAAV